jgi:radical SAM protein with 4Fe4S-binding SPASM domain
MSLTARLKSVATIPPEYLSETPPVPKSVKIEISSRCNYRCSYCALKTRKGVAPDMDFDFFKRISTEMRDIGINEFGVFYIGEPFTNPGLLVDCITFLKRDLKVPYVFLTTNGSLANGTKVKAVMKAGLDSLKYSVNFSDAEQFRSMSGVKDEGQFHSSLKSIKVAREIRDSFKYGTKIYASSIMYDPDQERRMKPLLKEHVLPYVDEHYWLPLFNDTAAFPNRPKSERIGNVAGYHDPVDPLPCWAVFTAAHVLVDGRLTACCHDATGQWAMGDLRKQSFMEAWHSEEYRVLRNAHLRKDVSGTRCVKCIDSTEG